MGEVILLPKFAANETFLYNMAPHRNYTDLHPVPLLHLPTEEWPDWADRGDWLHTEMVYPHTDGHSSKYSPAVHGRKPTRNLLITSPMP